MSSLCEIGFIPKPMILLCLEFLVLGLKKVALMGYSIMSKVFTNRRFSCQTSFADSNLSQYLLSDADSVLRQYL